MKIIFVLLLGITIGAYSQSIPNAGFEDWDITTDYELPEFWDGNSRFLWQFGGPFILQSSDAYSGNSAAEIRTAGIGFANDPTAGVLTNGTVTNGGTDFSEGGSPVSSLPDSAIFYYKYSTPANEEALAVFYFRKWDTTAGDRDTVGICSTTLPAAGNYTRVALSCLPTRQNAPAPDSVLIVFASSDTIPDTNGAVLLVDSISFKDTVTSVGEISAAIEFDVFPNPSSHQLNLRYSGTMFPAAVSIYNSAGAMLRQQKWGRASNLVLDVSGLPLGNYMIQVLTEEGKVGSKSFQIQ